MRAVALQRLMGHTDINVTLNTYTTIFNKYKEEELRKVNEYYLNNEIFSNNLLDSECHCNNIAETHDKML